MAVALLDTSTIVGYLNPDDALHASAVATLEPVVSSGAAVAMSAVTWSELSHGILLGRYAEGPVVRFTEDFGLDALPVDAYVAERAAELQKAYRDTRNRPPWPRLRTPDALILATADTYDDVTTVIAGDRQWANVPGVTADIVILREDA